MVKARAFFFVCAGLFLLALSYHVGARTAAGDSARSPRTVEAEKFVLRDASGRVRGMWTALGGDSVVFVLTDDSRHLISMSLTAGRWP
jgi:hypothetical protein